jgi:transposase
MSSGGGGGGGWRPPYPPEFRREAVRLVRESGRRRSEVARELGVSDESLRLWERQQRVDEEGGGDGLTRDERAELRRLQRENARLREEQEILRKAALFFARESGGPR